MELEGHTFGIVSKGILARPAQEKYTDASHPIIKEIETKIEFSTSFSGRDKEENKMISWIIQNKIK